SFRRWTRCKPGAGSSRCSPTALSPTGGASACAVRSAIRTPNRSTVFGWCSFCSAGPGPTPRCSKRCNACWTSASSRDTTPRSTGTRRAATPAPQGRRSCWRRSRPHAPVPRWFHHRGGGPESRLLGRAGSDLGSRDHEVVRCRLSLAIGAADQDTPVDAAQVVLHVPVHELRDAHVVRADRWPGGRLLPRHLGVVDIRARVVTLEHVVARAREPRGRALVVAADRASGRAVEDLLEGAVDRLVVLPLEGHGIERLPIAGDHLVEPDRDGGGRQVPERLLMPSIEPGGLA